MVALFAPSLYILHCAPRCKHWDAAITPLQKTMAPNDTDSTGDSPTLGCHADRNPSSANAQDQRLLKALEDLIVRVVDPTQRSDMNLTHRGPEAGKLIVALQEFISSIIVRSQSGTQNTILEVSLDEENDEFQRQGADRVDDHRKGDEASPEVDPLPRISSAESDGNAIGDINSVALEKPQPTFEEKLLRALRQHVFNKMPIRLLSFEQKGSSFRIALIEWDTIFVRLASLLKGNIHEEELRHKLRSFDLIETDEEVIKRLISKYAAYAILSHTWLRTPSGEVTYGDWTKGLFNSEDPGYRKLINFCKTVWKDHRVTFGWMDTVCINKESSSELDESIRSMYNWYSRAAVCITYLATTETLVNMYLDPWFTRGWTLQELLAPTFTKFYNCHWRRLADHLYNDKMDGTISEQIERATTITFFELGNIHTAPISRRMQLAATREVTREEDTAYSLMGMFNVNISTAYGEGAGRAFLRLLQEIMASSENALDILNWAGDTPFSHLDNPSAILPFSPRCYIRRSSNINLILPRPIKPLTLSHLGLHVPVILMPGISAWNTELRHNPIGDYKATVDISPVSFNYRDGIPTTYHLLDSRIFGKDGWKSNRQWYQMTFAVFNFASTRRNVISIPKTCIALGLDCDEPVGEVSASIDIQIIRTDEPIVFELGKRFTNSHDGDLRYWRIPTNELVEHGMQLASLYL